MTLLLHKFHFFYRLRGKHYQTGLDRLAHPKCRFDFDQSPTLDRKLVYSPSWAVHRIKQLFRWKFKKFAIVRSGKLSMTIFFRGQIIKSRLICHILSRMTMKSFFLADSLPLFPRQSLHSHHQTAGARYRSHSYSYFDCCFFRGSILFFIRNLKAWFPRRINDISIMRAPLPMFIRQCWQLAAILL